MPKSESKSGGKNPGKSIAMDGGSNLKLPTAGTEPQKFRDGSNIKVPAKPTPTSRPGKA
jgi:hypothetical protein